jgi:hypothetical protein
MALFEMLDKQAKVFILFTFQRFRFSRLRSIPKPKTFQGQRRANTACSGQERGRFKLRRVSAKWLFRSLSSSRQIPALAANACR